MSKRRVWIVAGAIVIAALVFPFQHEVTPAWWFIVVGPDTKAVASCAIEQHWEWLAAGVEGDETIASDSSGYVHFPARTTRISLVRLGLGTVRRFGFHAPFSATRSYFQGCGLGNNRERLNVETLVGMITYRYVPGSQAPLRTSPGREK